MFICDYKLIINNISVSLFFIYNIIDLYNYCIT